MRDARLQELLSRHGDLLRRTIAKVCPQAMGLSVEEIEQDARVRLWSALKSERDIVHPVSYIYKVAVSAALRAIRRAKARREDQLQEDAMPGRRRAGRTCSVRLRTRRPYAVAERREWVRKIDRAMTRLAENRRRAARLHLRGMTTQEIAGILGWSEPKARNLVHRGLQDLRTTCGRKASTTARGAVLIDKPPPPAGTRLAAAASRRAIPRDRTRVIALR